MRLNVRCCCQPQKILGSLEVSSNRDRFLVHESVSFKYPLANEPRNNVPVHEIQVRYFKNYEEGTLERAVYSDDRPIEFWRKIPGFRENKEAA